MIIDSHLHAGRANELTAAYTTFEDIRISIERMDACGIDRAIVLPIDTTKEADQETARIVSQYPDRLWGYAKVDQNRDAGAVRERLRYATQELGLKGLKLHGFPNREIMEACEEFRLPLLVDPVHKPWSLQYAAREFPAVKMIIAHFGSFLSRSTEAHQQTIWMARTLPNVYLDTSSVAWFSWLELGLKEAGAEKLVFGTDGPEMHCASELARVKALNASPQEMEKILWQNIVSIAGLKAWPPRPGAAP
jgi:hypothetical protein